MHPVWQRFFATVPLLWAAECFCVNAAELDYRNAVEELREAAEAEIRNGTLTGVSVALVDDQRLIFASGFGKADKRRNVPARPETVYRVGSISKLFTAIAAMQLAEQGRLNLDEPVTRYDSEFSIVVPFADAEPITPRQLMCHRSGLIREAPVGSYFDDSEPGTAKTVASLASCVLIHPPGTVTKYSNSGVTVVGRVIEKVTGLPFEQYQRQFVLGPLAMQSSGFLLERSFAPRLAKGYLPVAKPDGSFREMEAPQFEFGILPAGNLYSTVEDLSRFLMCLFAQGKTGEQRLLRAGTLQEMFTPQLTQSTNGFGLGFSVGHFRGRKTVSHMGAVYGFTSSLTAIPDAKLGVVVLCNDDIAIGPVRRLDQLALSLLLKAKLSDPRPVAAQAVSLRNEQLARFAGEYESESFWAKVEPAGEGLMANISNQRLRLTPIAPLKFQGSGRMAHESPFTFEADATGAISGFTALGQKFRRLDANALRATIPAAWQKFIGSYGPDFIPLIVSAKYGHLYAMTENEFDYRLTPLNQTVFQMPPGLYIDEHIVFHLDARGRVHSAVLANMKLPRR